MTLDVFSAQSMPTDRPRLTVYFDCDETKECLEAIALADDRAVSNFVLRLIKQAIRQAEARGLVTGDVSGRS